MHDNWAPSHICYTWASMGENRLWGVANNKGKAQTSLCILTVDQRLCYSLICKYHI